MSTTSAIAHYPVNMPATTTAPASVGASGKTDGDADQCVEAVPVVDQRQDIAPTGLQRDVAG